MKATHSNQLSPKPEATPKRIPQVAAIHDLCGYGNCSLGIVMPVLSAAGIEVCAVPTAYLSAHTAFPSYTFFDTTDSLSAYFAHWKEIKIPLDGAYTGFLGSAAQIDLIEHFFDDFPQMRIIVDPVMGDHGKIYKTYTKEMCEGMKRLAAKAELLTPNLTEAAVLLDQDYEGQNLTALEAEHVLDRLLKMGAASVILKGIERGDGRIVNACKGRRQPYVERNHHLREEKLHGTGDLFASLVTGGLFSGHDLLWSMEKAGEWTAQAIDISIHQPHFREKGVSFEPLMGEFACGFLGLDRSAPI